MSGSPKIDTSVAHSARRYNYWLGGKDHFAADRESGDAVAAAYPAIRIAVVENRRFLQRAVEFLASAGIRQFLDIGTGIPTANNTHEVAQAIAPEARVVYVDNDAIVLAHARALLTSSTQGATAYLDADLRDPEAILTDPDLLRTLDLTQPVALMLVAILHFLTEKDDPYSIVQRLLDALPSGSYLVVSHTTFDLLPPAVAARLEQMRHTSPAAPTPRSQAEVSRFFDGLELVSPGVVPLNDWRADDEPGPRPTTEEVSTFGGIGRKP